jgi:malonyl-CoA/methylmalonyl-CoA synthetase
MNSNLFAQFANRGRAKRAALHADAVTWSYSDLFAASARLAHALVERGVRPGDRVAVQIEKSPAGFALYLAALQAGAVFLPLNTGYTPTELAYFIDDAEPSLVVCDPASLEDLRKVASGRLETMDADGKGSLADMAEGRPSAFLTVARRGEDLAAILYTSGTTGRSKGAMLSHDNLRANAETLRQCWRFTSDDVLIHALPTYHAHGLFVAGNVTLLAGAAMHFRPRFDADEIVRLMPRSSVMMGVPTFYTRLLKHDGLAAACRGMRLFVSGSAPLLPETHREWRERTGHAILERYGMTETNMLTSNPYDGERVAGSVGPALPGVEVRVADPKSGALLPAGEVGVLEVKGPNVFKGYWRMPEKTKAEFRPDGFFITGDLGCIDERGYVHIVGRDKDLVISGGLNVYPREIEAEIDSIAGVVESAVIGLPHPDFGEAVTAVVVSDPAHVPTEEKIMSELQGKLARFKQPKRVLFIDELPRNTMGKVQKNALRQRYVDLFTVNTA